MTQLKLPWHIDFVRNPGRVIFVKLKWTTFYLDGVRGNLTPQSFNFERKKKKTKRITNIIRRELGMTKRVASYEENDQR